MRTKLILLTGMLILMLFTLSGCFVSPDPTLEPLEISSDNVPFGTVQPLPTVQATASPSPTPSPTPDTWTNSDQSTWQDWAKDALPTATPKTAATTAPDSVSWQTSSSDYNAGYPVLRVGSTGQDVSDLQARLTELRYYDGVIDGKYSTETQDAVSAFQAKNGLAADGIAGRQTQDLLYSSAAQPKVISVTDTSEGYVLLKQGTSGLDVRKLQGRLAELGYYSGGTDGIYGSTTTDAVKAFQRANGLSADGQAGTQTQTKLYSANAIAASNPVTTADPDSTRTLSLGMSGNDVYALQERLIALRYLGGVADGVYGEETMNAVLAFQKNNNLTADGTAGATTQKRIFGSAKAASSTTPTPVPSDVTVLHEGDYGDAVYRMQAKLFELGYFSGRIDGRFGSDTTEAVKAFQSANGLTVDGVPGKTTLSLISSGSAIAAGQEVTPTVAPQVTEQTTSASSLASITVLKKGDRSEAVRELQAALRKLGYLSSEPDGQFGSGTENAVKQFQRTNGLTADGIAGKGTISILLSSDAVAAGISTSSQTTVTATATPKPNTDIILQWESEGSDVLQYQARLVELGYLTSKNVTGKFNQPTVDATKAFQTMNGLKVDGAAGPQSLKLIYSKDAINADGVRIGDISGSISGAVDAAPEALLQTGMSGEQVQLLQSRLAALGYLSASFPSGTYDAETEDAVRRFQTANGIDADGQAGPATQSTLFSSVAKTMAVQQMSMNNEARETAEQRLNGANQTSLAGGGFLCAGGGKLYYADHDLGGCLVVSDGNTKRKLSEDHPRELHMTNNRLYYVTEDSGQDCILRMNADGTNREVLLREEIITRFLLHDGLIYFLDMNGNVKTSTLTGDVRTLTGNVLNMSLDRLNSALILVLPDRVISYSLADGSQDVLYTGNAEQAICFGDAVLVLTGGSILRVTREEAASIASDSASLVGAYQGNVIEVTGNGISVMDINGNNKREILSGSFDCMAVANGRLYAGDSTGFTVNVQL